MAAPSIRDSAATAYRNCQSDHQYVVTLPTYQAGDVVILQILQYCPNPDYRPTIAATGWTVLTPYRDDYLRANFAWRVMDGGEGATVTLTIGPADDITIYCRGHAVSVQDVADSPIEQDVPNYATSATVSTGISGDVTTGSADELLLAFYGPYLDGFGGDENLDADAGETEVYDDFAFVFNAALVTKPAATAGTYTVTVDFNPDLSPTGAYEVRTFAIGPVPPPPPVRFWTALI